MYKQMSAALVLMTLTGNVMAQVRCFGNSVDIEEVCLELSRDARGKQQTLVTVRDSDVRVKLGEFSRTTGDLVIEKPYKGREQTRMIEVARIRVSQPWTKASKIMVFTFDEAEMGEFSNNKNATIDPEVGGVPGSTVSSGPAKVSQEGISLSGVSSVTSMAQDPVNPKKIYAIGFHMPTKKSLLYSSKDGGKTWVDILALQGSNGFPSAISISGDGKKVAVLGGDLGKGTEVNFSSDFGDTWNSLTHQPSTDRIGGGKTDVRARVTSIHISSDGKSVYLGESRGIITKYSWGSNGLRETFKYPRLIQNVSGFTAPAMAHNIYTHPEVPGKLFVGTGNLVFRVNNQAGDVDVFRAGVYNDSTIYNIEFLKNKGLRFSSCNSVYQTGAGADFRTDAVPKFIRSRSGAFVNEYDKSIRHTPSYIRNYWVQSNPHNSSEVLAGSTSGLYQSLDSGKTWRKIYALPGEGKGKLNTAEYHKIIFVDKDTVLVNHAAYGNRPMPHFSRIKLR